jgi:hypothetical protein
MKLLVVLIILGLLPTAASAQKNSNSEKERGQLLSIEEQVVHANETCDRAVFDRIEAEEFIFTSSAGKVTDKQQDLDSLKDCRPSELKASFEDPIVQLHGEVAILNAQVTQHPTNKEGQVVTRHFRFTDVFVWRDGRWQMVVGHSSRIPDPPSVVK